MKKDERVLEALLSAEAHVYRQQWAGKHEQDCVDAEEWVSKYGLFMRNLRGYGRISKRPKGGRMKK